MMIITPDRAFEILEEHERCADLQYFVKAYGLRKPVSDRAYLLIRQVGKMDRILKRLKQNNKV